MLRCAWDFGTRSHVVYDDDAMRVVAVLSDGFLRGLWERRRGECAAKGARSMSDLALMLAGCPSRHLPEPE